MRAPRYSPENYNYGDDCLTISIQIDSALPAGRERVQIRIQKRPLIPAGTVRPRCGNYLDITPSPRAQNFSVGTISFLLPLPASNLPIEQLRVDSRQSLSLPLHHGSIRFEFAPTLPLIFYRGRHKISSPPVTRSPPAK